MIGTYVPPRRTAADPSDLRRALKNLLAARGIAADKHTLTALVAMSAFETGHWQSCWNWNFGNVKASGSWPGQYTCLRRVLEIIAGQRRWFDPEGETRGKGGPVIGQRYSLPPGHPQTRFCAYPDIESGLVAWVDKMTGRYNPALTVLLGGGDVNAFVAKLATLRYFTANVATYQAGVRSAYARYSDVGPDLQSVAGLQRALATLGYSPGPVDGISGKMTRAAVVAFQAANGLAPDGIVGPLTRAALTKALEDHE